MLYLFGGIILFVVADAVRGYFFAKNRERYLLRFFIITPIIIAVLFLFGPLFVFSPIKIGYSSLKENGITLYYPQNRIDFAKDMMEIVKTAEEYNHKFYRSSFPTPVVVTASELDMLRFGAYPFAAGSGNELAINILERKATANIIAHEISHRYLATVTGKTLAAPNWFNEGLASYIGKMDYYKKPDELKADLQQGRYIKDIVNIRGILGTVQWLLRIRSGQSRNLYGQSYLMTKYLFDKYGENKVYDFVASLKSNSFEKAFLNSFDMNETEFNQEFINYIENFPNQST